MNESYLKTVTKDIRSIPFTVRDDTSSLVTLLKSQFKERVETFYFPYPDFGVDEKEEGKRVIRVSQTDFEMCRSYFKYDTNMHMYNAVVRAGNEAGLFLKDKKLLIKYRLLQQREKKERLTDEKVVHQSNYVDDRILGSTDEDLIDANERDYNIRFMVCCKKEDVESIRKYQKLNHFPYSYYLGRKDQLYRNYQVQEDLFKDEYNFMPKTYIFPYDAKKFANAQAMSHASTLKHKYWIFKPTASSCGRGIKIIDDKTEIPEGNKGFLVSEYIDDPHLINGYKYDMRVYALVTSYDPMTVYVYNDGLIRFGTVKYNLNDKSIKEKLMHISNYSVQKTSKYYKQNDDASEDSSKWNFTMWEDVIKEQGHDVKITYLKIEDLIIKTLISAQDIIATAYDSGTSIKGGCYELYGFDIMLDSSMKPWLLEINTNPSLSSNSLLDKILKTKLAGDTLTLVGVKPISFSALAKEERREEHPKPKPDDYEGCNTHEQRNKRRAQLMSKINFKDLYEEDIDTLMTFEEEFKRMGNYRRIFPNKNTFRDYTKFFYKHSYNNLLLWKYLKNPKNNLDKYKIKKFDMHV